MKKAPSRRRDAEPSKASLRAVPEIDFSEATVLGRGAKGLAKARAMFASRRGRPKKGEVADGSTPRSVRFSNAMWRALEREAKKRNMTLHALLREVIAEWLSNAA